MLRNFNRLNNAFMYEYENNDMPEGEEILLRVPAPTPNARSINDICYLKSVGVELYGTISQKPEKAVWVLIEDGYDINKCVKFIKVVASAPGQYINIRISMN